MTRGSGHDHEEMPVFDAIDPTPIARSASGGSAVPPRLGPARGAGAAAAVLVLLVIGIAAGSSSLTEDPTGSPAGATDSSNSARPDGSGGDEACQPPGQSPAVTLAVQGTRRSADGLSEFGPGYGHQSQEPGWRVPGPSRGLLVGPGDQLELTGSLGACFRHLAVDYGAARTMPEPSTTTTIFDDNMTPSVGRLVLSTLPAGDWVVRVTTHFDTLGTVLGDVVTITYFRIFSGNGPFETSPPTRVPARAPLVSPAVPCGILVPTSDVAVSLNIGADNSVLGAVGRDAVPAEVHARLGDPIRMIVDGETCAVSWTIDLLDHESGIRSTIDSISNVAEDPTYVAQNRWDLPIGGRSGILTASLSFRGGLQAIRSWNVVADPFEVPALFLIGLDGARFEASAGCGLSLELSNGYQAGDSCGSIGYAPGPEALRVQAYRPIHLDLPGWQIVSWGASCGRVTTVDTQQFEQPDGCALGGAFSDGGGPLLDPPAFVLPPGDTVVQIGIGAVDGEGNRFNVAYYAHVIAR